MKFLLVSDLHDCIEAFEWINKLENQVDEVLFLGDVTNGSSDQEAKNVLSGFSKKVYFIPGNMDLPSLPESASEITHSVHGKSFKIGEVSFAAFGGSNPTIFNTPFESSEETIEKELDAISTERMVLMTHAPCYNTLDKITIGLHVGSKGIQNIVEKYHPIVAISGHIHEAFGTMKKDGTLFVNPGAAKEGHAAILEINGNDANVEFVGPKD